MRKVAFVFTSILLVGALAIPVSATKPDPDSGLESGHKITICHATSSLSNPYVEITIDIAAWDVDDPDKNDHGPHHTRTKDGITWSDYVLDDQDGECSLNGGGTTTTSTYGGGGET